VCCVVVVGVGGGGGGGVGGNHLAMVLISKRYAPDDKCKHNMLSA